MTWAVEVPGPEKCLRRGVKSTRYRSGVENPTNSHTGLRSIWTV